MKILFVWTGVTSYMADCWRTLAAGPDVELKVVVERLASGREFDAAKVLRNLDATLVGGDPRALPAGLLASLVSWRPDAVFVVGWHSKVVRAFVDAFPDVPKACCFDMPWRPKLRCFVARFVLARYVRKFEAAFVPGARAARYAAWLGFRRVRTGLFAIDVARFTSGEEPRAPRTGFLFLGRFVPEKRLDLVREAYARYRTEGGRWPLDVYGGGGPFVPPEEIPSLYRAHACLVLASAFDPWPLVLLEAKAAGCRAIASDRCGNVDELGARKVPYGDVAALTAALHEAERGGCAWREGAHAALDYDVRAWSRLVTDWCGEGLDAAPGQHAGNAREDRGSGRRMRRAPRPFGIFGVVFALPVLFVVDLL